MSLLRPPAAAALLAITFAVDVYPTKGEVVAFNNFAPDDSYRPEGNWEGSANSIEVMLGQRFQLSVGGAS